MYVVVAFRFIAFFLISLSLPAQFFEFAVTDDGRLFFSTPLTDGPPDTKGKIYKLTGEGLSLFASGPGNAFPSPSAISPLTSGDGSITGYALNYPCVSGSCGLAGLPRTLFQVPALGLKDAPYNSLRISRNGQFLLGWAYDARLRLIDVAAGKTREMPQFFSVTGVQCVTDSGSFLMRNGRDASQPIQIVPLGGEPLAIAGTEKTGDAIISPNGGRIAYERRTATSYDLYVTDPQGSAHTRLASAPLDLEEPWPVFSFRYSPSFANDGTLLFLAPSDDGKVQAMISAPGQEPRILPAIDSGVQNAIISGNGDRAWLASYTGRLILMNTADGTFTEVIPPTPFIAANAPIGVPGSVFRLMSNSFRPDTIFKLDGKPLPVSETTRDGVALQVPWEYTATGNDHSVSVQGAGSPFFQLITFFPLPFPTVTFERVGFTTALQAAHQDFRGIVTAGDPALPGETLHIFARNMGPVDRPVATGERSPSDPPARVSSPLACYLYSELPTTATSRTTGIVVPFAGLSGGSIGIYQLDVTIPADWPFSQGSIGCYLQTGDQLRGDIGRIDIRPAR
ncbi:MAG: hypothetical protein HYX27_09340 [Acidobacteria bacterium]|nr:hypothetical protein [Acidobacteriota bacterium]